MRVPPPEPNDPALSNPLSADASTLDGLTVNGAATEPLHSASKGARQLSVREQTQLARRVMRRQGALSLRVALVFVILLLGLPLFNLYKPEWATASVLGFPATWLFLGILFYPITVLLSLYFVRHSDRIEAEQTRELS